MRRPRHRVSGPPSRVEHTTERAVGFRTGMAVRGAGQSKCFLHDFVRCIKKENLGLFLAAGPKWTRASARPHPNHPPAPWVTYDPSGEMAWRSMSDLAVFSLLHPTRAREMRAPARAQTRAAQSAPISEWTKIDDRLMHGMLAELVCVPRAIPTELIAQT